MTKPRMQIDRHFRDIQANEIVEMNEGSMLWGMEWTGTDTWAEILKSKRILIVAEAGVGKTYECRQQKDRLWQAGQPAFFLDLAVLAGSQVREMISFDEATRLDAWLASQTDIATFFLDSLDELKLTLGNFEQALIRLSKAIHGQLNRARIVITTRPTPLDQDLVRRILPASQDVEEKVTGDKFAALALRQDRAALKIASSEICRNVMLLPLSDEQIRLMAKEQGIKDIDTFVRDIKRRDALDFARRPQDLIQICSDWLVHKRIRTHLEQVTYDVTTKLKPRTDRREKTELSHDRAIEGASRLALAALLTRKLTFRHSAEADTASTPLAALDPADILPDWTPAERETLLYRALFGFASYGRVRFHHRSVIEWLAAFRLRSLVSQGMPLRALKRLLLAETLHGKKVVRPSLRPVSAWLCLHNHPLFEEVRDREPEVLLHYGDPESMTLQQRSQTLQSYVDRYGAGGWRGMHTPWLQVQRFASADMTSEVRHLWNQGIENSEVRALLMRMIGAGRMQGCADIAYECAIVRNAPHTQRLFAVEALASLSDPRLPQITDSIEADPSLWPDALARYAVINLFPDHLRVDQLCRILKRLQNSANAAGDMSWQLPRAINDGTFSAIELESLREGLTSLVVENAVWDENHRRIRSPRSHLSPALASTCLRQLKIGVSTSDLARSIAVSLRIKHKDYGDEESCKELRRAIASTSVDFQRAAFLTNDAFNESIHPAQDKWHRFFEATREGPVQLNATKDLPWIIGELGNQEHPIDFRAFMLEVAIHLQGIEGDILDHIRGLLPYVADAPTLADIIELQMRPVPRNAWREKIEEEAEERRENAKNDEAKAHASWVHFWQEVSEHPDAMFDVTRENDTAWALWQAMRQEGDESRSNGWNRRLIERTFGKPVADRLRLTLMKVWRNDIPSLRSERPNAEKNTYLLRWQFGLAAITAEAEDQNWAMRLTPADAALAARYAPLQLNGFPPWLEDLVNAHPSAVNSVLGEELSRELEEAAIVQAPSMTLQNISHATAPVAALFAPRIIDALLRFSEPRELNTQGTADRLAQMIDLLVNLDDAIVFERIEAKAANELKKSSRGPVARIWLAALMRINPDAGVAWLENVVGATVSDEAENGAAWVAALFGMWHRSPLVSLTSDRLSPSLLLRLLRLAYRHVRPTEDAQREGSWTPDPRDHAEQGRNAILNVLLNTKGPEGWAAKLEIANDPMFAHFRHRAMAIAEERAAEEADGTAYDEAAFRLLDTFKETPPNTRDDMFALMADRLDGIEDLLLQDASPRAAWALIQDEATMRQVIARELEIAANGAYNVDQEAVTADQKETDIRLISTAANQQAVIELKIGEKDRSALDLRNALRDQLVTKYMAPENSRCGCLLITVAERTWRHPETNASLDLAGLIAMLNEAAARIVIEMGGGLRLMARGLDLRQRLPTEASKSSRNSK